MEEKSIPRIIAIVGPTASGKTHLAIKLARHLDAEIISADSRQIYRGMDIGTAKPTKAEQAAIPHHLINICEPTVDYSVADYKTAAVAAINDVLERGKLPMLVGGTGLYVKAVLDNLDIPKVAADPKIRKQIEKEIKEEGLSAVFEKLVELDPEAAYVVDPKNPRRIVRALEVIRATGEPFTAQRKKNPPEFAALRIGVSREPNLLKGLIDARVDQMIKNGLVDEVKHLVDCYGMNVRAFDAIGYREIIDSLKGNISMDEAKDLIKTNTWQFARRQITWFGKDPEVKWVDDQQDAEQLISDFLGQ